MKRFPVLGVLLAVFSLLAFVPRADAGQLTPALQARLATATSSERIPVIVQFSERVDLAPFARRSDRRAARAELLQALKARAASSQASLQASLHGQGAPVRELWIINALATEVPASDIETLAASPGVAYVASDIEIPAPAPQPLAAPSAAPIWNIDATGAPTLWSDGITGTGVTVAVLDTGVNPLHPDLAGKWRGNTGDWYDPYDPAATTPNDFSDYGLTHGTAVTSVILGGDYSGYAIGMAPDAQWIAARIFPQNASATTAGIHADMQWALDPNGDGDPADAPDIVNNSWGFESNINLCLPEFEADIAALQAAGINVIFSAGNTGPNLATSISPANNPQGFGVGSVGSGLQVSPISARGPSACGNSIYTAETGIEVFPEMLAPGDGIKVANGTSSFPDYADVAGTSFSAPHISGALALLRQAIPPGALSASDYSHALELALLESADDLGPLGPDNTYGYGFLNVDAAYLRLSGQPHLSLHTPGTPENDDLVDFGNIAPLTSSELTLTLKNNGGAPLTLDQVQTSGLALPFALVSNDCPASLAGDASCSVVVSFSPETFGSYSNQISIHSNDPRLPVHTVTFSGSGNNPPPAALLVAPANGTRVNASSVTFSWYQGDDPDGDPLTQTLFWSEDSLFLNQNYLIVALNAPLSRTLLTASTLLLGGLFLRRRRTLLLLSLLAGLLYLVSACGGGGGGGTPAPVPNYSETLTSLSPGTTYYWKVRTDDGLGGVVESSVHSFTTF